MGNESCRVFNLVGAFVQENGIIRDGTGMIIGRTTDQTMEEIEQRNTIFRLEQALKTGVPDILRRILDSIEIPDPILKKRITHETIRQIRFHSGYLIITIFIDDGDESIQIPYPIVSQHYIDSLKFTEHKFEG